MSAPVKISRVYFFPFRFFSKIEQRYELAKPHLRALASTVNSKGPGKTASSSFQEQGFALTDWQWALAIVSSRALTFRGERFLVPICDMFNYSPHPVMTSALVWLLLLFIQCSFVPCV
jgi:hypothetical protein